MTLNRCAELAFYLCGLLKAHRPTMSVSNMLADSRRMLALWCAPKCMHFYQYVSSYSDTCWTRPPSFTNKHVCLSICLSIVTCLKSRNKY